jgi:hypothetical protein
MSGTMQLQPRWILLLASVVALVLYWPGLHGPFIMDDDWNLQPLRLWLAGQASLREVLLPQASLLFSRPVAMGSFALTTWLLGADTYSFKLGNLIVHLACGWMGWAVLRRALARDARLAAQAELLATLAAVFWLLHPLQVSTVLYVVQRMAQLSTLFTLAAVWFYLVARQQLIDGRLRAGRLNLFLGFPAMLALGILSKQNAAVAPALCLVLELAYFGRVTKLDRSTGLFFGLFLWLPALAVAALLALAPERLLASYAEWDFTVWERLLTQPRALLDYLGMLMLPRGPLMGLYTDDFAVSHGLLSPPSTLIALLALAAISVAAVAFRKRAPSVFAGWFFFLVAHSVESGFLPLEMYYEHRNYLPSFGVFLAALGLMALVPKFQTNILSPRQLGLLAAIGFALLLCVGTLGRVLIWQDMGSIVQLGAKAHPDSIRARFDLAAWALQRKDYATAESSMRFLAASVNPRSRQLGNLSLVTMNCMRGVDQGNLQMMQMAVNEKLPRLTTYEAQAFRRLSGAIRTGGCGKLGVATAAGYLGRILEAASEQPDTSQPKWFSRSIVAEMYAHVGDWKPAQEQAELAWKGSGHDPRAGALLVSIYIKNGDLPAARAVLDELANLIKPYDKGGQSTLLALRRMLNDASK